MALNKRKLTVEREKQYDAFYDGKSVGKYYADLVIENKVIVEVKSVNLKRCDNKKYNNPKNPINSSAVPFEQQIWGKTES